MKKLVFSKDRERLDTELGLRQDDRTSRVLLEIMNDREPDLTFTMETMSMFQSLEIPTLDFTLWLEMEEGRPTLKHRFYSKPMSSPYSVLETSAWAWSPKSVSLAQEVFRRLQNTSDTLPSPDKTRILEEYTQKLKDSGYNRKQVREIMSAGIRNFERKKRRGLVHRTLETIQWDREVRKILEKGTWYRDKERDTEEDGRSLGPLRFSGQGRRKPRPQVRNKHQPVAPLFVPRTQGEP